MTRAAAPQGRYGWLAGSLILLAAAYPTLANGPFGQLVWTVVFWFVLLACVWAIGPRSPARLAVRVLGVAALVGSVASLWCFGATDSGHGFAYAILHGLSLVLLGLTTAITLRDVFGHERVTGRTLAGAACGYVLIGLTFAFAMLVLHSASVETLAVGQGEAEAATGVRVIASYLYFSFVTLSTLGYGDVVPQSSTGEVIAPAEAIVGQLYLAVFIGRLIAMHVSHRGRCPRCGVVGDGPDP